MTDLKSPSFILDEEKLCKNLNIIQELEQESGAQFILALKAFSMWGTFDLFKEVKSATASSLNEAKLCFEQLRKKAHTYAVAYIPNEFDEIAQRSSHITFNSLSQYKYFYQKIPKSVSIGLRINPGWSDVSTPLYNPTIEGSRLGIKPSNIHSLPERVEGLHFHVLCESDDIALKKVLNHFEKNASHLMKNVKWVNMGGGHLVTHKDYDRAHLIRLIKDFKNKYQVEVFFEPGSAFVWQTGELHCSVLDIVASDGYKTAILDISFTCHLPDCLEMPYRPEIRNSSKKNIVNWEPYRLGGVSCLAGDFLDTYWFPQSLKIGDKLVFEDMMHYTTVKTNFFNGIQHPTLAVRKKNGSIQVIKAFEYLDYKNKLS